MDDTTRRRVSPPPAFILAVTAAALLALSALLMLSVAMWSGRGFAFGMGGHGMMMHGGGSNTSGAPLATATANQQVAIRDFAFSPGNLQVAVGAQITFTNYDSAPHSATAKDGSWDTGILSQGQSKTITFSKPGDYTYYCVVHPSMVAKLSVR